MFVLRSKLPLLLVMTLGCLAQPSPPSSKESPPNVETANDFIRSIRPLLADRCFACHGPDAQTRSADLRLDTREGLFERRAGGSVVVPGRPQDSLLFQRINTNDSARRMPPRRSRKVLSEAEVELFRQWIQNGAPWGGHWAFDSPRRPVPPPIGDWGRNAIDAFVYAKLKANGLEPSPEGSPAGLLRRVTFDLTGLPPSLEALDAFHADSSPAAYDEAVEQRLASPQYGEHMAVGWLDAARYADTHGYHVDQARTAWPWRDWVIDAFNRNMPFDDFTVAQIAGDLLPGAEPQQVLATAFNRHHPISIEGGIVPEEYRVEYVADRVATLGSTWLGLSLGCARCHDHKFDPILQRDFYSLFACFNNLPEAGKGDDNAYAPTLAVDSPLQALGLAAAQDELAELDGQIRAIEDGQRDWEQALSERLPLDWHPLMPSAVSGTDTSLSVGPDGFIVAQDPSPDTSVYRVELPSAPGVVHAIRLDVVADDRFAEGGPGRSLSGNFVLTEFEVSLGDSPVPVPFDSATASFSQDGFAVQGASDGNRGTGWAIGGGENQDHYAVFVPKFPLTTTGRLVVRLHQLHGGRHTMGRFRVSISSDPDAAISPAILAKSARDRTGAERAALRAHFLERHADAAARAVDRRARFLNDRAQRLAPVPTSLIMRERDSERTTHVLYRGAYDQPREAVNCGVVPAVLAPAEDFRRDRLGLAQWLVRRDHPLTARVAVNRFWQHFFGRGLVSSPDDFGSQGSLPSHPELLDWLAVELIESGWDIKHIQRLIVQSATYRQSSVRPSDIDEVDPDNRWLSYFPSQRLPAEAIRDRALAASGLLVSEVGGPSVYPYQPFGLWIEQNDLGGFSLAYPEQRGLHLYRRSIYTFWKRTLPPPTMSLFDAPSREVSSVRRSNSNTPLQALALLNDVQAVEAARMLAGRVMRSSAGLSDQLTMAFRLATSRWPNETELGVLKGLYEEARASYRADLVGAQVLLHVGDMPLDRALSTAEHAAMTEVARILLNLGESVRKG